MIGHRAELSESPFLGFLESALASRYLDLVGVRVSLRFKLYELRLITCLVCGWQRRLQSEYITHDKFNTFLTNLEIFPSSQQAPPELIYFIRAGDSPEDSRHFKL